MSERNAYIINHNFELIFRRLNRDVIPTMEAFRKFMKRQRRANKWDALALILIDLYICYKEKHKYELTKELNELREEIDQLKGEQIMR